MFLYLFILAVLMNVFTFTYYEKRANFEESQFKKTNANYKNKLAVANEKLTDANYFSLENNQNAQDYFDNSNAKKILLYDKLIPFVKEQLLNFNDNPKGNPFTGQDQLGNQKFIINKVKILNHRWIIADYNDGQFWGEVLLKYFVNEDGTISFEIIKSLLYQK